MSRMSSDITTPRGAPTPKRRSSAARDSGFTLLELVIVLAIVVLLLAVLLPVLVYARGRSTRSACANNLRQLYDAFALYANDNDSYLPKYNNRIGGSETIDGIEYRQTDESAQLVGCLRPYIHEDAIWFCPVDPPYARQDTHPETWQGMTMGRINHRYTSYVYRAGQSTPRPPAMIDVSSNKASPSDVSLLTDNVWQCYTNPTWHDDSLYSHSGYFNQVFFDGHLAAFTLTTPRPGCTDSI